MVVDNLHLHHVMILHLDLLLLILLLTLDLTICVLLIPRKQRVVPRNGVLPVQPRCATIENMLQDDIMLATDMVSQIGGAAVCDLNAIKMRLVWGFTKRDRWTDHDRTHFGSGAVGHTAVDLAADDDHVVGFRVLLYRKTSQSATYSAA